MLVMLQPEAISRGAGELLTKRERRQRARQGAFFGAFMAAFDA
jgi:hypothetical protein